MFKKQRSCYLVPSVQFSSFIQSCPTHCDQMDWSTPGLSVHHQLPEPTQTYVHCASDAIQPSHPLSFPFFSSCPQSFPPSGSFQMSQLFALGGQSIGVSASMGQFTLAQFISVAQSCPTLCDPMNHSTPGLPVHHQFLEFTQTHIHRVRDAIQPSHPRSSPSPPAPNPSQHQSLSQ